MPNRTILEHPGPACLTCFVTLFQHSGDWGRRLPHVRPVRLGERLLRVGCPVSPVGLLHVEIFTQRRRQVT